MDMVAIIVTGVRRTLAAVKWLTSGRKIPEKINVQRGNKAMQNLLSGSNSVEQKAGADA